MDWSPYLLASKLILLICTTVVLPNPLYGEDAVMPSPEEGTYPAPPKMAIMVRRPLGTEGKEFLQKKRNRSFPFPRDLEPDFPKFGVEN